MATGAFIGNTHTTDPGKEINESESRIRRHSSLRLFV